MGSIEAKVLDWATEAADAFLNRQVGLNDTIRKIASREGLNREKVARVVEEANRAVFLKMFDKQADKTFTFDVAETGKVVAGSEAEPAADSVATAVIEAPPKTATEKTASDILLERTLQGNPVQRAWDVMEKAQVAIELIREKAAMARDNVIAAETNLAKIAQQMVAQEDYTFDELCTSLCSLRPRHYKKIATLLKVAAMHMGRKWTIPEGLAKTAGAAVDPGEHDVVERISAMGMPVEVINGSHQVVVALDTLIDQTTEAEKANKNLWSADDTVKYLRREIRNYLATHTYA